MAENKTFKIITQSKNFIYFVTQNDEDSDWYFNVGARPFSAYFMFENYFEDEASGLQVIMQIKLSLRHQPNYMRLTVCKTSPNKMKDLKPEYRKEIKKAIIKDTLTYENEEIPYYDYALILWEELNDREKFYLYETPNQEQRWTNTPLSKKETGLVMNVELVLQPKGSNELPYIIVQNDYAEKHNMNWVRLRLDGTVIGDTELIFEKECELVELKEWIEINKLAILMHWTGLKYSSDTLELIRTLSVVSPYCQIDKDWDSTRIIHAKKLEEYFNSVKPKITGKTIDRIFYTGTLYFKDWDMGDYEYKDGEWTNGERTTNPPAFYQWKERDVSMSLDSPVILDFEGERLEIEYWTGSLVNVNMNSIDLGKYGADVSSHFGINIIGQKLVDIKVHKTDKVYFMNFDSLGIERNDGDDMFEQIWFIFENGYVLELTTDHCDYTQFSEIPPYVYYNYIREI